MAIPSQRPLLSSLPGLPHVLPPSRLDVKVGPSVKQPVKQSGRQPTWSWQR